MKPTQSEIRMAQFLELLPITHWIRFWVRQDAARLTCDPDALAGRGRKGG